MRSTLASRVGGGYLFDVEAEANIFAHGHVRKQRVVLKDHRRWTALGRHIVDPIAADENVART